MSVSNAQDVRNHTIARCGDTHTPLNHRQKHSVHSVNTQTHRHRQTHTHTHTQTDTQLTTALHVCVHDFWADAIGPFFTWCMFPEEALHRHTHTHTHTHTHIWRETDIHTTPQQLRMDLTYTSVSWSSCISHIKRVCVCTSVTAFAKYFKQRQHRCVWGKNPYGHHRHRDTRANTAPCSLSL